MPTVIEDARPSDTSLLSEIHGRSFTRTWSEDEIAALAASDGVTVLVVRRANPLGTRTPVGFAIVRSAADEAEVLTIAVEPGQRGRGYGRALIEEAMRRLYADRIEALFLEVEEANAPAVGLYRSLGFREVGRREAYYAAAGDGSGGALVMRCDLR